MSLKFRIFIGLTVGGLSGVWAPLVSAAPNGWTDDFRLTQQAAASENPAIACDATGNSLYVAWADRRTGNWEIFFSRSFDQGRTWSAETNLTNHASDSTEPVLSWSAPNRLLLVFLDNRAGALDVYATLSTTDGSAWQDAMGVPGQLTAVSERGNTAATFSRPRATSNDAGLHVVWADNHLGSPHVFYRNLTVTAIVDLKPDSTGATLPAIACRNYSPIPSNTLYVVWEENTGPASQIFFSHSVNGGLTWLDENGGLGSSDISHKFNASASRAPDVYVSGDTAAGVDVTFLDNRQGTWQIYWQAGRLPGYPIVWDRGFLGSDAAPNTLTSLAVNPSGLGLSPRDTSRQTLVWADDRDGNREIYTQLGAGGGNIVFMPEVRLTSQSANSQKPAITTGDGFWGSQDHYLVWMDDRDGNSEIYFKRTDTIAPGVVMDLAATPGSNVGEIQLTWTAPDDAACRRAAYYDLRRDADAIGSLTEFTTEGILVTGEPSPETPGNLETMTVTGLTPGTTYYFALVSVDAAGNTSTVSNSPGAIAQNVPPSPTVTATLSATATIPATATPNPAGSATPSPTPSPSRTSTLTPWPDANTAGQDLRIVPHPATGSSVSLIYPLTGPAQVRVLVMNTAGERVSSIRETQQPNQGLGTTVWDIRSLAPGVYMLKVTLEMADGRTQSFPWRKAVVTR